MYPRVALQMSREDKSHRGSTDLLQRCSDQETTGGGRRNRGGKACGAESGLGEMTASERQRRAMPPGDCAVSAPKHHSREETTFASPAALNAGGADSHGAENSDVAGA